MRRMNSIRIASCTICKPHQPRKCVALPTGRQILTHSDIDQARNLPLKCTNLPRRTHFLGISRMFFPAKPENVNKHAHSSNRQCSASRSPVRYSLLPALIANDRPLSSSFATASFDVDSV
jgi:hypothetical protein